MRREDHDRPPSDLSSPPASRGRRGRRYGTGDMQTTASNDDLTVRAATDADRPAIIDLCRAALGRREGDPNEASLAWKHDRNAFGSSPAWVAVEPDGALAGVRVFLRWVFDAPAEGPVPAVRAVDTSPLSARRLTRVRVAAEKLAPPGGSAKRGIGYLLRRCGAHYTLRGAGPGALRDGFVPAPRIGTVLTWRPVNRPGVPSTGDLALTLGDVKPF